ncbi:MAG: ribonucleotide reductase subunit alpha [Gammaproteobacteria bacterium]|nr:MAG: ribonucleotide reductase subunit alpha [Gammaproteobacteria bacterium]
MSSNFKKMIDAAKAQEQPQRILIMLAKSEVEENDKEKGMSGTITPVICVDKTPDEITSFEDFIKEADSINSDWDMMFIAGLSGENNEMPTPEDADPILNQMVNNLMSGQDLSRYLVLDRNDDPVDIFP